MVYVLPFEQVCVCVLHVQEVCEELTHNRGCIHCNEKRKGGERVREMWRESGNLEYYWYALIELLVSVYVYEYS